MKFVQVDDRISAEIMQQFYRHLFNKESIEDAFHKTQETMRNKYHMKPYYWAACVLVQ
jgi:CHAT domain-containing protein